MGISINNLGMTNAGLMPLMELVDGYGIVFPPEVQLRHLEAIRKAHQEHEEYIQNLPPRKEQLVEFHDRIAGYKSTSIGV